MERETVYVVAWSDEDGMVFKLFQDLSKAKNELCSLFEQQADEEYSDDGLRYYAEEWEPDPDKSHAVRRAAGYRRTARRRGRGMCHGDVSADTFCVS